MIGLSVLLFFSVSLYTCDLYYFKYPLLLNAPPAS